MPTLPAHPNLDQLRRQAKELVRAATSGDGPALTRIHAVSEHLTLAAAQLALAREYGFESWPALARTTSNHQEFEDQRYERLATPPE
jgi:hypothetical protein